MENPVKELVEQSGMTLEEFAVTYGCLFTTLRNCVLTIPIRYPKVLLKRCRVQGLILMV